jgi:peptidoglycan L-alanyl-D-glutamate endopeptidase CwlK
MTMETLKRWLPARCDHLLIGVRPELVAVVRTAFSGWPHFRVLEGLRSEARQQALLNAGASQTLASKHLVGAAVDLLPLTDTDGDGKRGFQDWDEFFPLAQAMRTAARTHRVALRWGGVWDRTLNDLTRPPKLEVANYVKREHARDKAAGRRPSAFLDGPHFELVDV